MLVRVRCFANRLTRRSLTSTHRYTSKTRYSTLPASYAMHGSLIVCLCFRPRLVKWMKSLALSTKCILPSSRKRALLRHPSRPVTNFTLAETSCFHWKSTKSLVSFFECTNSGTDFSRNQSPLQVFRSRKSLLLVVGQSVAAVEAAAGPREEVGEHHAEVGEVAVAVVLAGVRSQSQAPAVALVEDSEVAVRWVSILAFLEYNVGDLFNFLCQILGDARMFRVSCEINTATSMGSLLMQCLYVCGMYHVVVYA